MAWFVPASEGNLQLVSRPRHTGRRRAPGPVRRLPDGFPRVGAAWAAKSVATAGVVGGAAVALALPVDASPAPLSLPVTGTTDTQDRTDLQSASRSEARSAAAPAPAVSAPVEAAPVVPETVGVAGVKAVAKPKPKPTPTPTETERATESSSSSSSSPSVTVSSSGISSKCSSLGLVTDAARLCTAVQRTFGIDSIGGYRPNAGEHSTGQAVDFMTSGSTGDAIAEFVQANAGTYDVQYVIWEQRYWEPGSSWELMEDRGSITANHYDHVHVTVN